MNIKIPESLDKAVDNLSSPITKSAGNSLRDIWDIVLGTKLSYAREKSIVKYELKLEEYKKKLEDKVSDIPENKLCEPDFHIVAQALEDSKYCVLVDELRDMFVNLLSNTMNLDTRDLVHPSFPDIIKQMSAVDAALMVLLKSTNTLPLVDYKLVENGSAAYTVLRSGVFLDDRFPYDSKQGAASISSLSRLGILRIRDTGTISVPGTYIRYENDPEFQAYSTEYEGSDKSVCLRKYFCELSAFGSNFLVTCVP